MIIWLASYPRSGNTLLRTVLKQSMGLRSYSDETIGPRVKFTDYAMESFGNLLLTNSWESFYHEASSSQDTFIVKTHLPPRDNQPAIYVVRDGRAATESYAAFHRDFAPDSKFCPTVLELMLGDDYYGDWSSHYHMWNSRSEGQVFLVRFEELQNADMQLLDKLRAMVHFAGEVKPFINPMKRLHSENPKFFRTGQTDWRSSSQWSVEFESLFAALHGDLLLQLNYLEPSEHKLALEEVDKSTVALAKLARRGFSERNSASHDARSKERVIGSLTEVCQERLNVINLLDAEIQRLRNI